ncbi:circadian clock KaiB family protein [Pararhodospirillum oryzae]|uniref:KaiB domain-containing protein n=1 Tax=Pararhodospirillum oryzae TaxID=478448 RepID=A0A512HC53_9PROT|nr:circadian clock KaiB family protein [Pararhodospirillum oryzae]GEO83019.1 hypothetical protein ROR02_31500 [Pararhodospirillum oryzae]
MVKLDLYLAGRSRNSMRALHNLKEWLAQYGGEGVELRVIDVLEHPDRALDEGVLVTPTVIRREPDPIRIVVGTLDLPDDVTVLLEQGAPSA